MADWSAAGGAAGAGDFLQKFLADKFAQDKFAEVQRQAKAAEAEQVAQRAQQAEQFRLAQATRQAEMVGTRDENYQNRVQDVAWRNTQLQDKQTDRELSRKEHTDDALRQAERDKAEQDWRTGESELNRKSAREIASIAASARSGGGSGKRRLVEWYDPQTQSNKRAFLTDDEAAAMGEIAPPQRIAVGLKEKLADLMEVKRLATAIKESGDKTGWRGVGPLAGRITGFKTETGLQADPRVERQHADIANLFSLLSHERFGAALTPSEIGRARGYNVERTQPKSKLISNLDGLIAMADEKFNNMSGGPAQIPGTAPPGAAELRRSGGGHGPDDGGDQAPMTATNPATGQKITSTDGGQTWH